MPLISEKGFKSVLRICIGLIFLLSAVSKAISPHNFIIETGKLNFFHPATDIYFAYGFIVFEFVLSVFLIFKPHRKVIIITGLTIFFLGSYLGYKVIIHDPSDCGCFGNFVYRSSFTALIQDMCMLIILIYIYDAHGVK